VLIASIGVAEPTMARVASSIIGRVQGARGTSIKAEAPPVKKKNTVSVEEQERANDSNSEPAATESSFGYGWLDSMTRTPGTGTEWPYLVTTKPPSVGRPSRSTKAAAKPLLALPAPQTNNRPSGIERDGQTEEISDAGRNASSILR